MRVVMIGRLEKFLEELGRLDTQNHREFELQSTKILSDYIDDESLSVYHQPTFQAHETQLRPDAMISKTRDGTPLSIVEVKLTRGTENPRFRQDWLKQVLTYINSANAEYGLLLSDKLFSVLDNNNRIDVEITNPSQDNIESAKEMLDSAEATDEKRQQTTSSKNIESDYFSLDINQFEDAVDLLDEAESSYKKGEAFEDLAGLLFGGVEFLKVRDKQLRTNTGEIDVVVEYEGYDEKTIFDEYSRFILAECKNWSDTVGVPQIRDFKGKMDKSYTDFGVIFAREGISGDDGADAIRWIHDYFQREGNVILVIDDDEIARIKSGEGFYNILDDLLYGRRFDLSL